MAKKKLTAAEERAMDEMLENARPLAWDNQPFLRSIHDHGREQERFDLAAAHAARLVGATNEKLPDLTTQEQRLVEYMASRKKAKFEDLIDQVWGRNVTDEAIEKAVQRLNAKLIDQPTRFAIKARCIVKE